MRNVPYSPSQQGLLDLLLASDEPLDIHQLVDLYYRDREKPRPWNAEIVIRKALRELIKKSKLNREDFIIQQVAQLGKNPALFRVSRTGKDKGLKSLEKNN